MVTEKQAEAVSKKPATHSFLLNIYHPLVPEQDTILVGTVEKLGNEGKHAFHDVQELLRLLGINEFISGGQDNEQAI